MVYTMLCTSLKLLHEYFGYLNFAPIFTQNCMVIKKAFQLCIINHVSVWKKNVCYLLLGVNLRCYLHRSTSLIFYGIWVLFMLIWFLRMVEPVIILLPFNLVVAIGWQTISYMVYRCLQQKKKNWSLLLV